MSSDSLTVRRLLRPPSAPLPLFRNAYFLILNTLSNNVLGIVYWAVASHLFSRHEIGQSAALISLMVLLSNLSSLNLNSALARLLQLSGRFSLRLVSRSYLVCTVNGAILSATVVGVWSAVSDSGPVAGIPVWLRLFFIAAVAHWTISQLQDAVLVGMRRASVVPMENLAFGVAKILTLWTVGVQIGSGGIFVSWILAAPLIAIPLNVLIFRRFLPHHSRTAPESRIERATVMRYIGIEYVGSLFSQAATNLIPVIVASSLGAVANSTFYAAFLITMALDAVGRAYAGSFTVEATRHPERLPDYLRRVEIRTAQTLLPVVVVVAIAAPLILQVFGKEYSEDGTAVLRIMLIGAVFRPLNSLTLALHRSRGASRDVVKVQALLAVLTLGLMLPGVHLGGLEGVAWAWTIATVLTAVVSVRDRLRHGGHAPTTVTLIRPS